MKINSPKFRAKIKRVIFLISMWVVAGVYIDIIRFVTMIWVIENISINREANNIPIEYNFSGILFLTIFEIVVAGLILAPIEVFYFTDRFKRKSFGYAVIIKSLFYLIGLLLLATLLRYLEYVFSGETNESFLKDLLFESLILLFIWGPLFLITNFILQVSDKFGQGVLGKFILGKYHTPKGETRIFMFLDMKSSTTIAEALGNERYFELLKDFFYDVTDAIVETKGEIYQYVGDEIVIYWKLNNGMENTNSLNCFFDIYDVVKKYSEKYQSKYDLIPSFKAGIHYGEVTVGVSWRAEKRNYFFRRCA